MVNNEWMSTLNALKQANKEKDEFINSLMDDISNHKVELRKARGELSALYLRAQVLQDKYIKERNSGA